MNIDLISTVVGYYALASNESIVGTGSAALVTGSEVSVRRFVQEFDPITARDCTIHKIRFGEIVGGLNRGVPYAFDEESYARFYPLAIEVRLPVVEADFAAARQQGHRLVGMR